MGSQRLSDADFLRLIDQAPLVSIDLIVRNRAGALLVGRRENRPAQGYWFVPGGRIRKGETRADAFARITEGELGRAVPFEQARLIDTYDHRYPDNVQGVESITTHYVVLAYGLEWSETVPLRADAQHSAFRWMTDAEVLADPEVHPNTRAYCTRS